MNALGLDVGGARVGVARINSIAQISEPLSVLSNDEKLVEEIITLIKDYDINLVVIGLPRNMKGEKTAQTLIVEEFSRNLTQVISTPILFQDETLSTVAAEARVSAKTKNMEDAYAACVILEDFILTNPGLVK